MSADRRIAALAGLPFHPDRIRPADDGYVCMDETLASAMLTQARLCDEADDVYRVSLDAAVEAAARARVDNDDYWNNRLDDEGREAQRAVVRATVTAALMGGAQ